MRIEGTHTFDAPRDAIWQALQDPEVLARTMPGCEKLERTGDNQFRGVLKIRVGTMQGVFTGLITLSDLQPPEQYTMQLDGNGALGFVRGEGMVRLEEQGEQTVMHYAGDAQVGGRIATVGQRLLDRSAKALTQQSLEALNEQITARQTAAATGEPVVEPEAPTQTQFAVGVARNMLADLAPSDEGRQLLLSALGLLGVFLLLRALENWWINRLARRIAAVLRESQR